MCDGVKEPHTTTTLLLPAVSTPFSWYTTYTSTTLNYYKTDARLRQRSALLAHSAFAARAEHAIAARS